MDIWNELSKVYNMDSVPDEAKSIIGDVMLAVSEQPEIIRCGECKFYDDAPCGIVKADCITMRQRQLEHGTGGRKMTPQEIDRIECAIRHIETSSDVDPWAYEIAVEAMEKQISKKPMVSIDVCNNNLRHLYCPTCGTWIGMWNKRLKGIDMHNNTNRNICAKCGQAIDCDLTEDEQNGRR